MKSAEVRDELIRALRLDLTGPEPGSVHEREELPDEPSRWYIGGFLVPFEASDEQKCDQTSNEELFAAGDEVGADDSDAPDRASARKAFLPSSIGLSVLTSAGLEELEAEVTWGDYSLPAAEGEGEGATKRAGDTWKREPKRSVLRVAVTGNGVRPLPLDLPDSGGLKLVVTARPADGMERLGLPAGTRSVSVFVVNYRRPAPDERKDEAMAFQVRLTVRGKQPFVPRPNATGLEAEDWDERVADLQYRDVVEFVVGHGVSARTLLGSDGECREVSTEWVPRAAVEKVEPTLMPGVELGMEALAAMKGPDEIKAALAPFPLRYAEWIGKQRNEIFEGRRAETAQFLLSDAALACSRITTGIGLLDDPQVFKAFQVANRVMARAARRRQAMLLKVRPEATRAPRVVPVPACVPSDEPAERGGPEVRGPERGRPSLLPDGRRKDRGLPGARGLHDGPSASPESGPFVGRGLGPDEIHAPSPDARPARARGGARLCPGARERDESRRARRMAVRGRSLGGPGGDAEPDGLEGRRRREHGEGEDASLQERQQALPAADSARELPLVRRRRSCRSRSRFCPTRTARPTCGSSA